MKKAILFDLDGTLIQFEQKTFEHEYFKRVTKRMVKLGFNPEQFMFQLNKAVKAMYKNDGTRTNEQVFVDCLKEIYSNEDFAIIDKEFTDFYNNNYDGLEEISTPNPEIKQIIEWCKNNFEYVLLTTNPFFPRFAVQQRLNWTKSGLKLEDFDLVVSGINNGFNIGIDTLYSGTIGAALDANLHGISSIALSAPRGKISDFEFILDQVLEKCFEIGESFGKEMYCLNVNFPKDPKDIKGYKLTRVGYFVDDLSMVEYNDGFKPAKYNLDYNHQDLSIDYSAHMANYISITPLTWDKTHNLHLQILKDKFE